MYSKSFHANFWNHDSNRQKKKKKDKNSSRSQILDRESPMKIKNKGMTQKPYLEFWSLSSEPHDFLTQCSNILGISATRNTSIPVNIKSSASLFWQQTTPAIAAACISIIWSNNQRLYLPQHFLPPVFVYAPCLPLHLPVAAAATRYSWLIGKAKHFLYSLYKYKQIQRLKVWLCFCFALTHAVISCTELITMATRCQKPFPNCRDYLSIGRQVQNKILL